MSAALPPNTRLSLACMLALSSGIALAQQEGQSAVKMQDMPGMDMSTMPMPGMSNKKAPASKPAAKPRPAEVSSHAAESGPGMPGYQRQHARSHAEATKSAKPKSKSTSSPNVAAPAKGVQTPTEQAMPSQMLMDTPGAAENHASHPVPAPLPRPTPAAVAAAFPDLAGMNMAAHMDEDPTIAVLRADRVEHVEGETTAWDVRLGAGNSFDKLWLRSEGEHTGGEQAEGDVELQWTHAVTPWWDSAMSLRSDFGPGSSRQWAGLGLIGLAPYKFDLEVHAYVGEQGRLAARLEGEYQLLFTNRLILTPRVELNAYSKDDPGNRIGKGLSQGQAGLRLRYEFNRQFAPYLGYAWTRSFGNSADLARAWDQPVLTHGWVAGLRFWF